MKIKKVNFFQQKDYDFHNQRPFFCLEKENSQKVAIPFKYLKKSHLTLEASTLFQQKEIYLRQVQVKANIFSNYI